MMKQKIKTNYKIFLTITILIIIMLPSYNANITKNPTKPVTTIDSTNEYDLLIIAPDVFIKYLKPLDDHKNKHGVKTKIVDVEDIYEIMYWQGRDKAEKIKYFIKEAYDNWGIKYVLLVGGLKGQSFEKYWVPVRYSNLDRGYLRENGEMLIEEKFLCDLYFADIIDSKGNFSNWDDNYNMKFSEWDVGQPATDKPDMIPDVAVGRLPCRYPFEVFFCVKKIINYETGKKPDSWFKKIVVIAGDTYPDKSTYVDGEVYTRQGLNYMTDFNPIKIWSSNGNLSDWKSIYPSFNQGCGFIWFSGHGGPTGWATHPVNDNETWIGGFQNKHIHMLNNKEKLPVCIAGSGCLVSMFNISLLNPAHIWRVYPFLSLSQILGDFPFPDILMNFNYLVSHPMSCWSEVQVKKPNGGTIATIASTGFSYETPDLNLGFGGCEQLDIAFFEQYGQKKVDILGDAWAGAITTFIQNNTINWDDTTFDGFAMAVKNAQQWLLMGDPSLKIGGYPDD